MQYARFHLGLVLLMSVCALTPQAGAQEIDPERYAQVKAGYVLNFLRLSQWPEATFENEQSPYVIAVSGHDAMTPFLRDLIRDEWINNRRVVLRQIEYPRPRQGEYDVDPELMEHYEREVRSAHVLFIGRGERPRLRMIVELAEGHSVLTVSDLSRFAENGGMLGLVVRDGKVGIDANALRIRESNVTVSSRVLRLARIVNEGEQPVR